MTHDPVAYSIALGIITSVICALFYAINLFRYKISTRVFDDIFLYVIATIIILTSLLFSNMAYVASRYPVLDYHGWLTSESYLPYTKSAILVSILLYIRAFVGDRYPFVWLYCSVASLLATVLAYIFLT